MLNNVSSLNTPENKRQSAMIVKEGVNDTGKTKKRFGPVKHQGLQTKQHWIPLKARIAISILVGLAWALLAIYLAIPWAKDLAPYTTLVGAWAIITGIAIIPGYLNMQLASALLLDRQPNLVLLQDAPSVTILVAAYNEEKRIKQTLQAIVEQEYPGVFKIIVIDDGSTDKTTNVVRDFAKINSKVRLLELEHAGKSLALNYALAKADTPLIVTVDADTLLLPGSLHKVVSRLVQHKAAACAGAIILANNEENLMTRIQKWDYLFSISSVKAKQTMLAGTLVAQGAFSAYTTKALRAIGGWPDQVGEDIIVTWGLMAKEGLITHEPTGFARTFVPETFIGFVNQRSRWARGMVQGLQKYGIELVKRKKPYSHSIFIDMIFPIVDFFYTFAFIPGIILASFGIFAIVGIYTIAVLPLSLVTGFIMYQRERELYKTENLKIKRDIFAYILFLLFYQVFNSPFSLLGYAKELSRQAQKW